MSNTYQQDPGENATCPHCTRVITKKTHRESVWWDCRTKLFDMTCPYDIKRARFRRAQARDALRETHESFRREPVAT